MESLTKNTYFINIKIKARKYIIVRFLIDKKLFYEAFIKVIIYFET
jgi:hypothetical protein